MWEVEVKLNFERFREQECSLLVAVLITWNADKGEEEGGEGTEGEGEEEDGEGEEKGEEEIEGEEGGEEGGEGTEGEGEGEEETEGEGTEEEEGKDLDYEYLMFKKVNKKMEEINIYQYITY